MCWRRRAAAWISVRWSIAQWTSVSPASARQVAAASPRLLPRTRSSAALHRGTWSAADRARTASLRGVRLRRSAAVMRVMVERPYWPLRRSTRPSKPRCCAVTSVAVTTSMTRCGPDAGRRTTRRRPESSTTSRCTPRTVPCRAPESRAPMAPRASPGMPPSTVSRGWKSTDAASPSPSTIRRSTSTSGLSAPPSRDLSDFFTKLSRTRDMTTLCGGRGTGRSRGARARARTPIRVGWQVGGGDTLYRPGSPGHPGPQVRLGLGPAPLAQSAEHSHGKAGVVGSIPTGGSQNGRGACRAFRASATSRWHPIQGGVAQLVRALGS